MDQKRSIHDAEGVADADRRVCCFDVYRQVTSCDEVTTYAITAPGWTPERVVQGLNDRTVQEGVSGLIHGGQRIADIVSREVDPTEWSMEHALLADE